MGEYIKKMRQAIGNDPLLLVGCSVIVHRDGQVLLQKRADNGCWAEAGGYLELGENCEEAAKRELFEEMGIIAHSLELVCICAGEHMQFTYPNGDHVYIVDIAYLCEDFSGEIRAQEEEVSDIRWFSIDDLPENISPPSVEPLKKCLGRIRAKR